MTDQTGAVLSPAKRVIYHDSVTGQFVSPEYAAIHPDTTQRQVVDVPPIGDPLGDAIAVVTTLTDSVPAWTVRIAGGIEITGTDPVLMAHQAADAARKIMGDIDGSA